MSNDFYLFANCNFVPDKYNDWQAAYDQLAEYVWNKEPTTKTYYFGIPLDYAHDFSKTISMFAFEVYGSREDLYTTHLSSPAMKTFLSRIPSSSTTGLDLSHYALKSGFLDITNTAQECGIMQDVRIVTTSASARCTVLASLGHLIANVDRQERQERERNGEAGVLTFTAFKSLDDEVSVRIFGRWTTRETFELFVRREGVVGFWIESKDHVKSMEQRLYLPNGKGWLHRGSAYKGADPSGARSRI